MNIEEYRAYLFAIAYRMLGSAMEAEDILQEVYLRTRDNAADDIRNPKAYLSTITTRLCLNHLERASQRRETYVGPWLPEPLVVSDPATSPENVTVAHDSISMAFMVLLQRLNPAERAIFLLRDVFDYDYSDIARIVGKSEDSCRQTFSRAKKRLDAEKPRFRATVEQHHALLHRFMDANNTGDMHGLVSLLVNDVVMVADGGGKRVAALYPLHGVDVVAPFLMGSRRNSPEGATVEIKPVNGAPGIVFRDSAGMAHFVLQVQPSTEGRISHVFVVSNPEKIGHL